jgi:hydroxymethylbilane synthase
MNSIKLGTRGSKLALWQAAYVAEAIRKAVPQVTVDIKVIRTTGDRILDRALSKIGDKGLFTKELERELVNGGIDIAVHSLKDMTSQLGKGLYIGAVLERENPQDALISKYEFSGLPYGAIIGTSSLRRAAQLKAARPDLRIEDIRGNIETRINKMKQQNLDGIILAYAGIKRLRLDRYIGEILPVDIMLPAAGQGIIAVEAREADSNIRDILSLINNQATFLAAQAERSFLFQLEGGCQVPMACLAELKAGKLVVSGLVASLDGKTVFRSARESAENDASEAGRRLALDLLNLGAYDILNQFRK